MFDVLAQEPSLRSIWLIYGLSGFGGFLLCRYRYWFAYLILPCILFLSFPLLMELYDPSVGPEIRRESMVYFVEVQLAMILALGAPFFGARQQLSDLREERRRNLRPAAPARTAAP